MRKRLLFLWACVTALTLGSVTAIGPANAAGLESDRAPQRASCSSPSVSFWLHAVAQDAYTVELSGSVSCTEPPVWIWVCILQRIPNGDYVEVACGAGGGIDRASASAETVCVPGETYKASVAWPSGPDIEIIRMSSFTC